MPAEIQNLQGVFERIELAVLLPESGDGIWDTSLWDTGTWSSKGFDFLDITEFVLGVTTKRGKAAFQETFQVGTMTLTLDNDDGVWNPDTQAQVGDARFRPGRLVQYSVAADGSPWIPIFTGIVDSIDEGYATAGATSTTVVVVNELSSLFAVYNAPDLQAALPQQLSSSRVNAILDLAGYDVERAVNIGQNEVISSVLPGNYWTEMQKAARAEGGAVYMLGDGTVRFQANGWIDYVNPVDDVSIGFVPSQLQIEGVDSVWQTQNIFNDNQFSAEGGLVQFALGSGSVALYGQRTLRVAGLQNASDVDVLALADEALVISQWDRLRVKTLTLSISNEFDVRAAIELIIGNVALIQVRTAQFAYTKRVWISGIDFRSVSDDLRCTLQVVDMSIAAPDDIGSFDTAYSDAWFSLS